MAGQQGCGPLHAVYVAAREGSADALAATWDAVDRQAIEPDVLDQNAVAVEGDVLAAVDEAVGRGDAEAVVEILEPTLFAEESTDRLSGPLVRVVGAILHAFGYVAAFVLFFRAHSPDAVVSRLRWAYGVVGVDIRHTETADGVERTTFRCPYRSIGADRWGRRRLCHDVLDRVDDGYVTFLDRHRDIEYDRPRPCAGGDCCYSEVEAR